MKVMVSWFFFLALGTPLLAAITNLEVHSVASHNENFAFTENRAATALLTWETDVPATSQVLYGGSAVNLELSSRFDGRLKTRHMLRIQHRVLENQTLFFKAVSRDAAGNLMSSAVESFVTPASSQWWEVAHDRNYKKNNFNDGTRWVQGGNYYRRTITLADSPVAAWIQMNRWERFEGGIKLYVNGVQAGIWSFGFSLDTLDITSLLTSGANTLALSVEASETVAVLLDGEVVLGDNSRVVLQTRTDGWRTATIAPPGWELPGFDDSGWSLATGAALPSATSGFYSPLLLAALPGANELNRHLLTYTRILARRDRLLDQGLIQYAHLRSWLDLPDVDKNLADTMALAGLDALFDVQTQIDEAYAFIQASNPAAALASLDAAGSALDQIEAIVAAIESLLDASARLLSLQATATTISQPLSLAGELNAYGNLLVDARNLLAGIDYDGGQDLLDQLLAHLDFARIRVENHNGVVLSGHNQSDDSPFGPIRTRGRFAERLFGTWYDSLEGVLKLGNGEIFSQIPADLSPQFRDSADLLSPLVGFNTDQAFWDFAASLTHIAYAAAGGTSIRELVAGTVYDLDPDPAWDAPWLLAWDSSQSNRVFLFVLQHQPESLGLVEGKLRINRAAGLGEMVIYSMYPNGLSLTSDTSAIASWALGLPAEVGSDLNQIWPMMLALPLGYSESYSQDFQGGTGTISMNFIHHRIMDDWGSSPVLMAPLPNALGLALDNSYANLVVSQKLVDSRNGTSDWGNFRFAAGTATLNYQFPLLNPTPLNGVNETISRGFIKTEPVSRSGFNSIRGQILIQNEGGGSGGFVLRDGWQSILTDELNRANDAGLTAVFFIWNNGGRSDNLDTNPEYQNAFIAAWGQVASVARDFDVFYDLTNEPEFDSVAVYNDVMARAAQAIRAADPANPITIEGFDDFAQNFDGMLHPADQIPGLENIWFQFHPYNGNLHQNLSAIDQYYPGYQMSWWERGFYDLDAYLADRWLPALRSLWTDDRVRLINGEYGFMLTATGVDEAMARDSVRLARRFGAHQFYFVTTGWSGFDLYGGEGDTAMERSNITQILLELGQKQDYLYRDWLADLAVWANSALTDSCGQSNTNVLNLVGVINNGFTCP